MENYSLADVAAATRGSGNSDGGWGNDGAWVLIILFALIFGNGWFGGNGANTGNSGGGSVTEAGLCNSMNFNNLENAVGRLADSQNAGLMSLQNAFCQNGYETLQNFNTVNVGMLNGFNGLQSQIAQCCCDVQRGIDSVNYNGAINTNTIVQAIGFHTNRSKSDFRGSEQKNREIREIVNQMNENELRELVNRHAQELQERGNNGSYQRLYDRTRRYKRR